MTFSSLCHFIDNLLAIRQATKWYSQHLLFALQSSKPSAADKDNPRLPLDVILITDDADNLRKAKADSLLAFSGKFLRMI